MMVGTCDRDHMPYEAKQFIIYLQKQFANPCPDGILHRSENERTMKQHE